jgi:hypothetical protein
MVLEPASVSATVSAFASVTDIPAPEAVTVF